LSSSSSFATEQEKFDLDFPFAVGEQGSIRMTDAIDHIKDEIITILLTAPGERVNQPEFGCGLKELIFAGNSEILSTMVDFRVVQALDRWLGDKIDTNGVNVQSDEEQLLIEVNYTIKDTSVQDRLVLTIRLI
jgi:Bacteriophage baseplate protein W